MAGTDGPLSPTSPIDFRYAGGGRENEEEGGGGAVTGNWIGISIDLRRNDKMHINADVKQKALLNGARYTALVNPPLSGYKTGQLEIRNQIRYCRG